MEAWKAFSVIALLASIVLVFGFSVYANWNTRDVREIVLENSQLRNAHALETYKVATLTRTNKELTEQLVAANKVAFPDAGMRIAMAEQQLGKEKERTKQLADSLAAEKRVREQKENEVTRLAKENARLQQEVQARDEREAVEANQRRQRAESKNKENPFSFKSSVPDVVYCPRGDRGCRSEALRQRCADGGYRRPYIPDRGNPSRAYFAC